MEPVLDDEPDQMEESDKGGERTDTDKTDGEDSVRTPAQSRSPSVQPVVENDGVDLFDGYSFKGRHSVLIDEEDEEAEVEEDEDEGEDEDDMDAQRLDELPAIHTTDVEDGRTTPTEEAVPKTPEARKARLPDNFDQPSPSVTEPAARPDSQILPEDIAPAVPEKSLDEASPTPESTPKLDKDVFQPMAPEPVAKEIPPVPAADDVVSKLPAAVASIPNAPTRQPRGRREKSGVHALDKYLSDGGADEEEDVVDEDDDWDLVEAPGGEDRNGAKGTSLFARGVVDRYRLAVFRKVSTPGKNNSQRNVSGMSQRSDITVSEASPSPSPSAKQRRGRNPALTFRRNPKQFLRARSPAPPPSSFSGLSNGSGKTLVHSNTMSSSTSSGNLTSPPLSAHPSFTAGPSLKSKESTTSMGSPSSDDQSINGDDLGSSSKKQTGSPEASRRLNGDTPTEVEPEKPKSKKLKKYKEGAEKVLSLFASPRQ